MKSFVRPAALVVGAACLLWAAPAARADKEKEILKTKALMAFLTPDGKTLVAAGNNNIRIVDLAAKKSVPLSRAYHPIVLSPDGKTLAALEPLTDDQYLATLFNVPKAQMSASFPIPSQGALAVALTPDGKTFCYGTLKELLVIDADGGKVKHTFKDLGGQPWSVRVSADGKYLACGTDSKKVFVWDLATRKPVQTFAGMPSFVQSVAFTPDGKLLAASSDDVIKVWDLATGKEAYSFKGTKDKIVRKVAFGADGKILVSGCSDGVVTVWDMASGKPLDTIKFDKDVFGVSLSADAKVLSVTTEGEETRVFDLSAVVGK